jgi:hypothetical protein
MARLSFPIRSGELTLAVLIGHNQQALAAFRATAQPLPAPVWTTGVIDTGRTVTCISSAILRKLGLASTRKSTSQTVHGRTTVNLFDVSLSIPPPGSAPGPMLTQSDLIVMEMPSSIPGVDVLVGMDVLLGCKLVVEGPSRQFTVEF